MRRLGMRAGAALGTLCAVGGAKASLASAQPKLDLSKIEAGKTGSKGETLPGASLLETIVSWAWWSAMLLIVMAMVISGGMYAWYAMRKKGGDTNTAVTVFLAALGGAVVVGGAGLLANTLFGIGYNTFK